MLFEKAFDAALPQAAVKDLEEAYTLLKKINNEEHESKGLSQKLDQYQQLTERVKSASNAYEQLGKAIADNQAALDEENNK